MVIHFSFLAKIVNVKQSFLYGDFKGKIYMESPQGMANVSKIDCIALNKCTYGLIQAAMQCYKSLMVLLVER